MILTAPMCVCPMCAGVFHRQACYCPSPNCASPPLSCSHPAPLPSRSTDLGMAAQTYDFLDSSTHELTAQVKVSFTKVGQVRLLIQLLLQLPLLLLQPHKVAP
jgi:hypothetical protein